MDRISPAQRSQIMSKVRQKDTEPEMRLRKALWHRGLRYRLQGKLPGHPDIVFQSRKLAIFVDGCFWHGCPIHGDSPKTNAAYWNNKITRNKNRDYKVGKELRDMGWKVLRFWEHEIHEDVSKCVKEIVNHLR